MPVSPDRDAGGDQSPIQLRGYMDDSASRVSVPPPAALREARCTGSPERCRGRSAAASAAVADGSQTRRRRVCRTPLRAGSQPTLRGHTPCVSRRGWRGAAPPLTPATETAQRERRSRRLGEGPRQRRGACRVARQGALGRLDAVRSGAPVARPVAHLDRAARRGRARAHAGGGAHRKQPQPDRPVGQHSPSGADTVVSVELMGVRWRGSRCLIPADWVQA